MKTKTEILVMIADLGWNDEPAWRLVDDEAALSKVCGMLLEVLR